MADLKRKKKSQEYIDDSDDPQDTGVSLRGKNISELLLFNFYGCVNRREQRKRVRQPIHNRIMR